MKKEESFELGKFFINALAFDGEDPVKDYILKRNSSSIKQRTEAKVILMKCLKTAEKMKAKKAPKEDLLKLVRYAYVLLETQEHNMDLKKAEADFQVQNLRQKYA